MLNDILLLMLQMDCEQYYADVNDINLNSFKPMQSDAPKPTNLRLSLCAIFTHNPLQHALSWSERLGVCLSPCVTVACLLVQLSRITLFVHYMMSCTSFVLMMYSVPIMHW